jgi:EAL domain-containing protein (putative c-di-GMP-specific phosphodiesterase class I)
MLTAFGCDLAQGFYLSRPVPPAGLASWIRTGDVRLREAV